MPSLKSLRSRIKSVKNTRQITKTMKMVAAAKVRKARVAVDGTRPYASKLAQVLANVAGGSSGGSLLFTGRPNPKTILLIVVGTDRGLCGALNTNLLKQAYAFYAAHPGTKFVSVGRKIRDALKSTHPTALLTSFAEMGRTVEVTQAQTIVAYAREQFENGTVDEIHLLYAACQNMLTQIPTTTQLVPFVTPVVAGAQPTTAIASSIEYEPSPEAVLDQLLPLNLNMQVFNAMLETQASEQAARMTAMDNATRNAGEMIKRLTITYNRTRQAAITKELIEIISGAEAL